MRKNLFTILLVIMLFTFSGCDSDNKVKIYENTEDVTVEHIEANMTAVVTNMDFENNVISFLDCASGDTYELGYHGGVTVFNTYGEAISISSVCNGSVVDVEYYSDTMRLVSIEYSDSVTTLKGINKFSADIDGGIARYKGTTCNLWDNVVAFDGDMPIDIMEISTEDQVTMYLYRNKLVSVVVELGHGYVRLDNQDTYIGGFVEVGYDVIVPVTSDMLITVRDGEDTLRITKNGYSQSNEVKVEKGKETYVDLTAIAIPTGTVTFNITPSDATLYVGGDEMSSHSFTGIYGTYSLKIVAEGYNTFRGSVTISESLKSYDIKLTELEEEDTEEDEEDTEEEDSEDTTEENTEGNTEEDAESTEDEERGEITTESVETTGNVITINAPVNVDVYVDGEYVGVAPISFPKTVGTHTVTLYKTGYLIKSYTIYASNNGKDDEYSFDELTSLIDALE